jgi:hypothetical protein
MPPKRTNLESAKTPKPSIIKAPYPTRGLDKIHGYSEQPALTSHSAVNTRPFSAISQRWTGGPRCGLVDYLGEAAGTGRIQDMNLALMGFNQDYSTPDGFDPCEGGPAHEYNSCLPAGTPFDPDNPTHWPDRDGDPDGICGNSGLQGYLCCGGGTAPSNATQYCELKICGTGAATGLYVPEDYFKYQDSAGDWQTAGAIKKGTTCYEISSTCIGWCPGNLLAPPFTTLVDCNVLGTCLNCEGTPSACGDCCFSSSSSINVVYYENICHYKDDVCGTHWTGAAGVDNFRYNSGLAMSLVWQSADVWRTADTVLKQKRNVNCGVAWADDATRYYFWVRRECTGDKRWQHGTTTSTTPPEAWGDIGDGTGEDCKNWNYSESGLCVDHGNPNFSINDSTVKTGEVVNNGCCNNGGTCQPGDPDDDGGCPGI